MKTKFTVPCAHCGKESNIEINENIHQVNERLLLMDKKFMGILKEVQVFTKMIEGYDEFLVDCSKCSFRKKGSLGQVLKINHCPNCKVKLELKALILPPEESFFV